MVPNTPRYKETTTMFSNKTRRLYAKTFWVSFAIGFIIGVLRGLTKPAEVQ